MLHYHQHLVDLMFLTIDRLYHDTSARVETTCMSQGLPKRVLSNLHPRIHLVYDQLRLDKSGHPICPPLVCGSFGALFAFVLLGNKSEISRDCNLHIDTFLFREYCEDAYIWITMVARPQKLWKLRAHSAARLMVVNADLKADKLSTPRCI